MTDVPKNIERRVEQKEAETGLDVKEIKVEEQDRDGTDYRIVVDDPDAEDGENPSFIAIHPTEGNGLEMFGQRLEAGMREIKRRVLGDDEIDQQLQETREQMDPNHPNATGEEVEYGDGPIPDTSGIQGGYDDGQVRVESISDAPVPEVDRSAQSAQQTTDDRNPQKGPTTNDQTQETTMNIETDTIYGKIADAALDAQELEEKGHDTASEALLREIQQDITDALGEDD